MDKNYVVVQNSDQFEEMLNHIKESTYIAYDTETTGLNTRKDKVIGFSVSGSEGVGYYYPTYRWNGSVLEHAYGESERRMLEGVDMLMNAIIGKKLIMFNASYDCRITKQSIGVDLIPSLYCDAMLLKHTCDEEFPFGLKDIAKKIQSQIGLDVESAANQEQIDMVESIKTNGGSVTKESYELYKADMMKIGIYACADTDLTLRIFNHYSAVLEKEELVDFFYHHEVMPLYKHVTIPMEETGIPIDVERIQTERINIIKDIAYLENEIHELVNPYLDSFYDWHLNKEFPSSNTGSFAQALCEHAELDLPKTDTGKYSLKRSNVEALEPSFYKDFLLGDYELDPDIVRSVQMKLAKDNDKLFNISSKHHLSKLFFGELQEESITKTPSGKPQMNDLFLDSVASKYEFVPLIRTYNKLNKIKSAYMDRFLEKQENGIFYPSFMQHRTISGRYGSDMQQLPRPFESADGVDPRVYKYTNMIREFFISGEGYVFIDADYESLEPHVFAHVSGDEGLKNIFRNGNDFYSTIAIATEKLSKVSPSKKSPEYLGKIDPGKRQKAKAYALGIPYGMEGFKLSKTLDIEQREADKLIDDYLNAYPKLRDWMIRSEDACKNYGKVRSEAGRVRHMKIAAALWHNDRDILFESNGNLIDALKLWKKFNEKPSRYKSWKWKRKQMKNFLNNSKNFQIQSLAASITNRACIAIARELKRQKVDGHVCAQVHDQIVVRVPKAQAEKWQRTVQYLMENTYKISLDLKAPAEVGTNLREAH